MSPWQQQAAVGGWYTRTGLNAGSTGNLGLANVSDLSSDVADATARDDDPNPIGHAISSGLRFVWNTTMLIGDWYNRNVYQPLIDDPVVFGNLAVQAPWYKKSDQSLADYLRDAWNVRDELSVGQTAWVPEWASRDGLNPVADPTAFRERLSPTVTDPVTGEQSQQTNWSSGIIDFAFTLAADPLSYTGGPTKALTRGMTAPKIVSDLEKAQTGISRTRGVVSLTRVNELLDKGEMDGVLGRLAGISDPKVSREYLRSLKLGTDDPDTFAYLSSQIGSVEGQKDLFNVALNPHSASAEMSVARLREQHGADFAYYAQRHAGQDPLLPEAVATPDDLALGPQTQQVMTAVVEKADAANSAALARAEVFARGLDKINDSPTPGLANAPTTNAVFEHYAWRRAARRASAVSNDPVVSTYKPHRWHPTTWYVEKPAGLVEPDSPDAFAEMDASMRLLDRLTGGEFVKSGRADEFAQRWFAASTLAEPATERGAIAGALNEYALRKLIKKHHGDGLSKQQTDALVEMVGKKSERMNRQIREKGWLSALTDSGEVGIVRHPLLQRATPNAVSMYDFQAVDRVVRSFDTPGLKALLTAGMEGTTAALDAVLGVWKVSVLMRLGYTIRNLTEASLSMAATGNLGNVLAEVGPERMRSWMLASQRAGRRTVDRIGTAGGILDEPQALWDQRQAWDGVRAATEAHAQQVLDNLSAKQIRRLAKSPDPAMQAKARRLEAIRTELRSKGVTYHANALHGKAWHPAPNRALSTTPSATLAGQKGAAHQITSYGDTLDFTRGSTKDFPSALVSAAKFGDRAAVQRLSDAAFARGYGRIRLPDTKEWGGVQVVVNQRAIGAKGAKRIVDMKLRRLMAEADEAAVPPKVGAPTPAARATVRAKTKKARARGHLLPVNPDFDDDLLDAMLSGGLEEFAAKLATRRAAVDAHLDFLSMRLEAARRRTSKSAPLRSQGRGFQQGSRDVRSVGGIWYDQLDDPFGGDAGGMWERIISGDTTYSVLSGDSYRGVLTSGAMASKVVQPDNPRYFEAWANILNLHFRDHQSGIIDPAVRKILDGESFDDILAWATSTKDGYQWSRGLGITRLGDGAAPEMARKADLAHADTVEKAVASLMSAVDLYAPPGVVRDALANGGEITQDLLRAATEGKELVPLQALLVPTSAEAAREYTLYQRFMRNGVGRMMRVLGSIPESSFARHPLFASTFQSERRTLIGAAEQGAGRALTFDELQRIDLQAKRRAQRTVQQTLFTLTRRSTLSGNAAVRSLFPFVAAWENVLQRWSRFVVQDPMLPVRFSNYVDKFDRNVTVINSDGDEVKAGQYPDDAMLVLPGLDSLHLPGRLGQTASLLATTTLVPVKSLDVLTQGQPLNPGLGPLGVLPVTELVRRRPDAQRMFEWALPYGVPESNWQVIMPTAAQRAMQLWTESSVVTNTTSKAWLIATYRHEVEGGPEPKFEDVEKMATSMQFLRGFLSLTAPFATSLSSERDWFAGKLRDYQAIYGQDEGETRFFYDFPDAGLLVESLSRNPASVRATVQTVDNTKRYRAEVAKAYGDGDPEVAGFVMNYGVPDDALFSQAAYQWQRSNAPVRGSKDTYRQVGNPEDQVREAHVREGWNLYRQVVDGVAAQLQFKGVSPDSGVYADAMTSAKRTVAQYLYRDAGNTDWYQEYINPDTAKYMRRAESFKTLLADTSFARDHANDTLIQSMRAFLALRDVVVAELQRRDMAGGASTLSAADNDDLARAFDADVERLANDSPEFRAWHQRFFANDSVKA